MIRSTLLEASWWTPRRCRIVAIVAAAIALSRAAPGITVFTNTVDEPFHLGAAVALWDVRKHVLGTEHPPLPRLVAGLPLYFSGVRLPAELRSTTVRGESESLEQGVRILFHSKLNYSQMLHRARLAMLVFPAIAFVYLYLLARSVANDMVAMLAVVFFSFDATLLGHAFWVCTDAAACAGFLAASYHGLQWIERRTWSAAAAAGAAIGLAIACKFSCALVIPGLLLVLIIRSISFRHMHFRPVRLTICQLAVVTLVAFVALWGTYLFDISPMSDQTAFGPQRHWQMIPQRVKDAPLPMPSFTLGVLRLLGHNRWGHPAYLNGHISRYGWWYYFPEAIALKSPVALLSGLLIAAGAIAWLRGKGLAPNMYIMLIGAVFLIAAMSSNLSLGVRHLLPIIPLLYLLVCTIMVKARLTVVLAGLIAAAGIETAIVHPDYIAFFNVVAGGPARGERRLIDSNLDWGQDVGRLATWLNSGAVANRPYTLRLFAFPQPQLIAYLGLDPEARERAPAGLFAISKNIRHGMAGIELLQDGSIRQNGDYSWVTRFPLVKRIGFSIEVYDLSSEQMAQRQE